MITFEAALVLALTVLSLPTDIPVDRMGRGWGSPGVAAWTYERDVIAVGVDIEWDEQATGWERQFVAAHEACHIKFHMRWIKAKAGTITREQRMRNEMEANRCAMIVVAQLADGDAFTGRENLSPGAGKP